MSAWPSIAWTARRSAPPASRCPANEWRSVCGETRSRIPAAFAHRPIRFHSVCRVIGRPRRERNRTLPAPFFFRNRGRPRCTYSWSVSRAGWATGTTRSFPPLPRTRKKPAFASTFSSRSVTTSEARRPDAYMSSSIALSRIPSGVSPSGADRRCSTSDRVRYLGRGRPVLGPLASEIGLAGRIPSRTRYLKNDRTVETCRAALRAERPSSRREERNERKCDRENSFGGIPAEETNEDNLRMSKPYDSTVLPESRRSVRRWRRKASERTSMSTTAYRFPGCRAASPGRPASATPDRISWMIASLVARSTTAHVGFPLKNPHPSPGFRIRALPIFISSGRWVWPNRIRSYFPPPRGGGGGAQKDPPPPPPPRRPPPGARRGQGP